jgi:hypothetical protein
MYLNHLESSKEARLTQILHTLKNVHGVQLNVNLDSPSTEDFLNECKTSWESKRDQIVAESNFNSYQQNPEYIKTMLILEAVRIMLTEIGPKRRRRKQMSESTIETTEAEMNQGPTNKFADDLGKIAERIPQTSEEANMFSIVLASIARKAQKIGTLFGTQAKDFDDDEKAILAWIKGLPKPINVNSMIRDGIAKFGPGLLAKRSAHLASQPKIDLGKDDMKETTDQDDDGDNDFADVQIARMVASGMPKASAIAKTKGKPYNKESISEDADPESPEPQPAPSAVSPVVGQAHHYEYQASMARSELYRNSKYAMSMLKQIDPKGEVEPWIAGALTKAANLLDKVYHYLDYYKKFEPQELPEADEAEGLGETSGGVSRQNLMMIMEYSIKLFDMIEPGDKLEGWVAMKLTTASECVSSCKHYMDYVQFEHHAMDDHFTEAKRAKRNEVKESRKLLEQEDLAKAATILSAKDMSGKIQDIAEDVAKMSVEDLMPLVDMMRNQFGSEAADGFNTTVKSALDSLLKLSTKTKETMDKAIETLNSGGVPAETTDIETAGEEPADDSDISKDLAALGGEEGAAEEEPDADIGEPLGRAKKDELAEALAVGKKVNVTNPKATPRYEVVSIDGDKVTVKKPDGSEMTLPKDRIMRANPGLTEGKIPDAFKKNIEKMKAKDKNADEDKQEVDEAWDTKMHTAKKDIGKWNGWTIDRLKKHKASLMSKEERSAAEQKEVKQIDFAIRAKQKDKWGKVKKEDIEEAKGAKEPGAVATAKVKEMGPKYWTGKQLTKKGITKRDEIIAAIEREKSSGVNESTVEEKAPPGKKAEDFIKGNKAEFKKRYGDRWQEVLYATAWKKFGKKEEGYVQAGKALAEAKAELEGLEKIMAEHRAEFKTMLEEGKASDPLYMGYGLEGDAILDQIAEVDKRITAAKNSMKSIMKEGVIGMLRDIESLNKARSLEATKSLTPYGVIYTTAGGRKSKKMFESADARAYWLELKIDSIKDPRMIEPETFDSAITRTKKG